jgi:transcriptional regulator with XRE-family HTH domain
VKLSAGRIRRLCADRGLSLQVFLEAAGVSRTAYYSLARRPSVLPRSVHAMARMLDVAPSTILEESAPAAARAQAMLEEARIILKHNPRAAFENVWHTLVLLDEPPVERLRRSLLRARTADLH